MKKGILVAALFAAVIGFCALQRAQATKSKKVDYTKIPHKIAGIVPPADIFLQMRSSGIKPNGKQVGISGSKYTPRLASELERNERFWCFGGLWSPYNECYATGFWKGGEYKTVAVELIAQVNDYRPNSREVDIFDYFTQRFQRFYILDKKGKPVVSVTKPRYLRDKKGYLGLENYTITDISPSNQYVLYLKKLPGVPGLYSGQVLLGIEKILTLENHNQRMLQLEKNWRMQNRRRLEDAVKKKYSK